MTTVHRQDNVKYHSAQTIKIKPCICPYWNGGLGNLMFEYASLYGISQLKEMTLVINQNDTIATVFPNIPQVNTKYTTSKPCDNASVVSEKQACAFGMESYSFKRSAVVLHKSYLQSWRYFQLVENDIRKQFVFKPDVQHQARANIEHQVKQYLNNSENFKDLQIIGVHIRRGDYLLKDKIQFGYNVATKQYIDDAMDYFKSKYNNTLFLVFTGSKTEDLKWREEHLSGSNIIHMEPKSKEVDMCSISLCNHTIITVGTFGWWSAWLGQGTTIYYKDVARRNSSLRNDFSSDITDFFYPGWIGM
jgi:galactoside 2-L-fucosyltransferase 1/2